MALFEKGNFMQSEEENIKEIKELNHKHKLFCEQYVIDFNGSRSYKHVYGDVTDETARVNASKLLTNANVKEYVKEIQKDLSKLANVSALMVVLELKKIAFSSIANLHNTWIERKGFEELTEDQKSVIEVIDTKVEKRKIFESDTDIEIHYVKIKLYDKMKAMEMLSKMMGWNAPDKTDVTTNGKEIHQNISILNIDPLAINEQANDSDTED